MNLEFSKKSKKATLILELLRNNVPLHKISERKY